MDSYTVPSYSTFANGTVVPVTVSTLSLYSESEKRALRIIAMTFASLSILAGSLMMYWYIRLPKRTFRHTLILGLICADCGRSFLELIYPIITLSRGDVAAGSTYANVSGFFTAYFFEASDLMVFIIAIHTAVYVFNPKLIHSNDQGGIWRWRYYIFPLWIAIPGLLAGLAFINPVPYVPLVTWCYIPARPLVWRYALAWGPRYFILLTISILYIALYIHVRRVYHTLDRNQRDGSSESDTEVHGSFASQGTRQEPIQPPPPTYFNRKRPSIPPPLHEYPENESSVSTRTNTSHVESPSPTSETSMIHSQHPPSLHPPPPTETRNLSVSTTLAASLPASLRHLSTTTDHIPTNPSFRQRRARVERQMRTLFIFPIVYFIMWIPPFINNIYQTITYNSTATVLPSGTFIVTMLATIFLPAQGFVNVCVYAVRERPWRRRDKRSSLHAQSSRASRTFGDWSFQEKEGDLQAQIDAAKVNHMKMSNPAQAAYTRRDIERGERELARQTLEGRQRGRDNWWDDEIEEGRRVK